MTKTGTNLTGKSELLTKKGLYSQRCIVIWHTGELVWHIQAEGRRCKNAVTNRSREAEGGRGVVDSSPEFE